MNLDNLSLLTSLFPNNNLETLNLKDEKDYKKFNDIVDDLEYQFKNNVFLSSLFGKDVFDSIRKFADNYRNSLENNCDATDEYETCDGNCTECNNECCVCDELTESNESNDSNSEEKSVLPSANIKNIETKMQIHRLTQEYVDTMLKPYMEKGPNTTNNINNAYTALFEFACWIYNR